MSIDVEVAIVFLGRFYSISPLIVQRPTMSNVHLSKVSKKVVLTRVMSNVKSIHVDYPTIHVVTVNVIHKRHPNCAVASAMLYFFQ
jgi:hypothetical protein